MLLGNYFPFSVFPKFSVFTFRWNGRYARRIWRNARWYIFSFIPLFCVVLSVSWLTGCGWLKKIQKLINEGLRWKSTNWWLFTMHLGSLGQTLLNKTWNHFLLFFNQHRSPCQDIAKQNWIEIASNPFEIKSQTCCQGSKITLSGVKILRQMIS